MMSRTAAAFSSSISPCTMMNRGLGSTPSEICNGKSDVPEGTPAPLHSEEEPQRGGCRPGQRPADTLPGPWRQPLPARGEPGDGRTDRQPHEHEDRRVDEHERDDKPRHDQGQDDHYRTSYTQN